MSIFSDKVYTIMPITITLRSMFFAAILYFTIGVIFSVMKRNMSGMTIAKFKIFKSIIISYMINVMYFFRWDKVSSNRFFYHKSVLSNIPSTVSIWMVGRKNKHISFTTFLSSTFPVSSSLTSSISLKTLKTKFGFKLSYSTNSLINSNFTAFNTFRFKHGYCNSTTAWSPL